MSSLFGIAANGASEFYPEKINQSLRFDGNAKLLRTPSSDGDRKKWTTSFWLKRAKIGALQYLWSGSSYSGNDGIAAIYINSDDKIHTYFDTSGSNPYGAVNDRVYRDTTNWYHIVWAVDAVNTVQRIWVNGVEETLASGNNPPNYAYGMNKAGTSQGFGVATWGGSPNLEAYLANIVHLDGQYLDESYFGETKNGVWIPKAISGLTFGTNGFHLDFANSGSVGNDISGNNNDYTPTGFASTDVVPDSPTNNFAVLNPLAKTSSLTLAEGSLKWSSGSYSYQGTTATIGMPTSGKWYFECYIVTAGAATSHDFGIGVVSIDDDGSHGTSANNNTHNNGAFYVTRRDSGTRIMVDGSSVFLNHTASVTAGQFMQCAFDADSGKIWFGRNNSWWDSSVTAYSAANGPSAGNNNPGTIDSGHQYIIMFNGYTNQYVVVANFGQDSSFAGNKTSGSANASDANGIGDFYYTPPTDFLALCSANLPDTTLSPNQAEQADDYFNTHLYSGDGNSTQNVTGVGFQPDWTWIKERSSTSGNVIADTNRGYDKFLTSNANNAESTGILNSVLSDGFQTTNSGASNQSSQTYVSWNWKINGGTTTTDSNGNRTSTIQTNSDVGISIATFTNTSGNFTFGHGLGSVPEMFWWKSRIGTQNWIVYHPLETPSVPSQKGLYLNSTSGGFTTGANWITELSSTTIAITNGQVSSGSNIDYIVYSFKSVEGFSKIGNFTGNGSADGAFVYTDFRPAWVIIKRTNGTGEWFIMDNKRIGYNGANYRLLANDTLVEYSGSNSNIVDFLSNGFKCRTTSTNTNGNNDTYLYMAFAEQPFKFSNAR